MSILIGISKGLLVGMANVLPGVHSLNCKKHRAEGELAQADGQLLTAEVGHQSSLDLQGPYQPRFVMRPKSTPHTIRRNGLLFRKRIDAI
jgi:hypothetical protein